ncbi:MAG TPA: winged helix-turn-helix domain-containing protein [Streptosporangiaceae bacterium]|nr:winged helix-turn-helix domain-containing protein [Streptosporangiaceae bacterium]
MVRVKFTAGDLARTRFSTAPAPLVETGLALTELTGAELRRDGPRRARRWLREARRAFPHTARPLLELFGPRGPWPTFTESSSEDLDEALEFVRATPRSYLRTELADIWRCRGGRPSAWVRQLADGDAEALETVVTGLRDIHDAIVAPRWESVVSSFHGDMARRMPVLAAGGHEVLFDTIDDRLRWREDGLDRQGNNGEYELGGAGIVLIPSVFWSGPPVFGLGDGLRIEHKLMYAARPNGQPAEPALTGQMRADQAGADYLAALLGPTRAAVLRALAEPRSTAELADAVEISAASASEHAKVLREANLIDTRRQGRSVRHSLTPMGRSIVGQLPAALTG